jgi:hypothetical protein
MLGCKTIPGIEEPTFWVCDIVNVDKAVCYNITDPTQTEIEKGMVDMLGYSCLNPRAFGETDQHHEALHIKIEELGGAK